jgi:hypothetical protein
MMAGRLYGLITHTGPALPMNPPTPHIVYGRVPADLASADLQHGGKLDKPCLVLVRVMLAEEKLGSRRQRGAYASGGTAAVAAVSSG